MGRASRSSLKKGSALPRICSMMNWNCLPAISVGAPPAAAIASKASRIGPGESRGPVLSAVVTSGELSVAVMARPRLSAQNEDTRSRYPKQKILGNHERAHQYDGLWVRCLRPRLTVREERRGTSRVRANYSPPG